MCYFKEFSLHWVYTKRGLYIKKRNGKQKQLKYGVTEDPGYFGSDRVPDKEVLNCIY